MIESPEVEKEVKRLLRADASAVKVCILLNSAMLEARARGL